MLLHPTSDYALERYNFLRELEDLRLDAYSDPEGIPTIGVGINLQVSSNLDAVLEVLGFDVSGTLLTGAALEAELNYIQQIRDAVNILYVPNDDSVLDMTLNNILAARRADEQYDGSFTRREFFQFNDEVEAQTAFNAIIGQYETQLDNWLANNGIAAIDPSKERTALISLTFNNAGALLGPKLAAALQADDRAEAWYEIAYNSNGGASVSQGIANRRYREADLFGIYTDAPDEADYKSAYRMYTRHKQTILGADGVLGGSDGYEDNFPPPEAGMGILDQLAPARAFLIQKYVVDELGLAAAAIDGDVLVGQDVTFTQVGAGAQTWSVNDDLTGTDAADLMLGGEGTDTLHGGAGADVLYGENSNDDLFGGAGADQLFGGDEQDTLVGLNDDLTTDDGQRDVLAGGNGDDLYYLGNSDVVIDSDGVGSLFWLGQAVALAGGELVAWMQRSGIRDELAADFPVFHFVPYGLRTEAALDHSIPSLPRCVRCWGFSPLQPRRTPRGCKREPSLSKALFAQRIWRPTIA